MHSADDVFLVLDICILRNEEMLKRTIEKQDFSSEIRDLRGGTKDIQHRSDVIFASGVPRISPLNRKSSCS